MMVLFEMFFKNLPVTSHLKERKEERERKKARKKKKEAI